MEWIKLPWDSRKKILSYIPAHGVSEEQLNAQRRILRVIPIQGKSVLFKQHFRLLDDFLGGPDIGKTKNWLMW
jgi:hypothetical protein